MPPPIVGGRPPRKPRFSLRTFESLADPNYRWFFVSLAGHMASLNMQLFIRGYLVFQLTESYAALGIVSLANAIPGLLFSLGGGVLADRVRSKRLLIMACLGASLLNVLAIGVLIALDALTVGHLYISAVVHGAFMSLMMPARQVLTSEVVGLDRLMNALALNNAGMNVSRLLMPALGGYLVAVIGSGQGVDGAEYVYFIMAALYAISMLGMSRVRAANRDISQRARTTVSGVLAELGAGLVYMRRDATVRMLLIVNFLLVLGAMPYLQLLPGFADDVLGADSSGLGLLLSVQGIGSLGGALFIASLPSRNRGQLLLLSSLVIGIGLAFFSWSTSFWLTFGILVIVGLGQAGRMALSQVLVQSYSEEQYRGRVQSIYMMEHSLMQVGVFFVGLLANVIGPQWAIGSTAALTLIVVVYALLFLPQMRRLQ